MHLENSKISFRINFPEQTMVSSDLCWGNRAESIFLLVWLMMPCSGAFNALPKWISSIAEIP